MASETWEGLRKKARQLEIDIDSKLVSLNKLHSSPNSTRIDMTGGAQTSTPKSKREVFEALARDIESLISGLTKVNNQMADIAQQSTANGNSSLQHTLRRHREILRDYCTEFQRSHANMNSQLHREELLSGSPSTEDDSSSHLNTRNRATDFYLKENEHLGSCDRLIDDQINLAMGVKENLHRQRSQMFDVTKKLQLLGKKFPMVNSLMMKIKTKKQRDTIILSGVIAACFIFTFLYVFY
uniref:Golgi SNAP receptor complex member 1 n=1 Tax=Steinernema glaseri TaxID=37863 RepID=A0A1I7YNN0_9BILA